MWWNSQKLHKMSKDLEKVCKSQQQIEDMSMMPMEISALHKQK